MPWRHLIFPVDGGTYIDPQLVTPPAAPTQPAITVATMQSFLGTTGNTPASLTCADSIPHIPREWLLDLQGKNRPLGSTIFQLTHLTSEMPHHEFVRRVSAERQIAREARLDAVLSNDLKPWSFTSFTSATEDAPKAAHNEDQNEEVLDEEILQSNITRLSLIFQGDELNDILAASAAIPPPLRRSGRGAAMVSVCSPRESAALQARPARIATARSCAHEASFFATFCEDVDRVSA
ncbi:hypothetical protein T484DRAFT_1898006 [Baffinella frigidus]|nr:hypothetical protein T484DRAFT_1898006 [Cryptophyta sp. CCMP2293]